MNKPNPIEVAVAPLREDAIIRAEKEALDYISKAEAELAEFGWDVNLAAPYPRNLGGGFAYHMARFKYDNFRSITESDPAKGYQRSNFDSPHFVVMSKERIDRFVDLRKKQAALEYDAFVAKLVKKIGHVLSATLHGNHVWDHSVLTVTLPDGEVQRWKTQQIVNVSKYSRLINQWPTRRMK